MLICVHTGISAYSIDNQLEVGCMEEDCQVQGTQDLFSVYCRIERCTEPLQCCLSCSGMSAVFQLDCATQQSLGSNGLRWDAAVIARAHRNIFKAQLDVRKEIK